MPRWGNHIVPSPMSPVSMFWLQHQCLGQSLVGFSADHGKHPRIRHHLVWMEVLFRLISCYIFHFCGLSLYSKTYQWSLRWWCSWHQFLGQILVSPNSDLHRCVDRHKTGLCQIMVLSLENCDVDDNSHHSLFNSFCFIWFERFVNICVTMRVHIYHIKAYYPSIQWILRTKSICCFNHAHAIFWIDKKKKLFEAKTKIRNVS